jgi:hypothetical protein
MEEIEKNEPLYSDPTLENYILYKDTELYYATYKQGEFNTLDIRLTDNNTLVAFFSSSEELALGYIMNCKINPEENAYIHKFRVKKDIDKIKIISTNDLRKGQKDLQFIQETFCNPSSEPFRQRYNGIGFFYKKGTNIQQNIKINDKYANEEEIEYDGDFAICDPNNLEYINTKRCVNNGLSREYRFDNDNIENNTENE